jgi:hypothetical protein
MYYLRICLNNGYLSAQLLSQRQTTQHSFIKFNSNSMELSPSQEVASSAATQEHKSRSQWPRGLRHELFSPAPTLGSWVRIPHRHGCLCVFCVRIISELKL